MKIIVCEKIIERYHMPWDRELDGHIKSITRKEIGALYSNPNNVCFNVGDIIALNFKGQKKKYKVVNRIFATEGYTEESDFVDDGKDMKTLNLFIEVEKYNGVVTKNYGSDSWQEIIPTVVDIKGWNEEKENKKENEEQKENSCEIEIENKDTKITKQLNSKMDKIKKRI